MKPAGAGQVRDNMAAVISAATHGVHSERASYPHHAHSIDRWDDATGSNLYEHLAGVNDQEADGHSSIMA